MSSLAVSPSHGAGSARWLSLARPSLAQLVWRVRLGDSRSLLPSLLPGGRDLLQLAWRRSTQPRGVCWLGRDAPERAIAAATGDRKPVVQRVLSTGFRAGSLWGCWGRQGAFPSPRKEMVAVPRVPGPRCCWGALLPHTSLSPRQARGSLHAEIVTAVLSLGPGRGENGRLQAKRFSHAPDLSN